MSKQIAFNVVDAFVISGKLFTGNPAAIIILKHDNDIPDDIKQKIAFEFNLSETAFVSKVYENDPETWLIRWFTPVKEVPLCGHATVAASYVLFKEYHHLLTIKYISHFGLKLECQREVDGQLTLNFPVNESIQLFSSMNAWLPQLCEAILGPELSQQIIDYQISTNTKKLLLRLKDDLPEEDLLKFNPDYNQMKSIDSGNQITGVIVTQKANYQDKGLHFRSRYFAPWAGIDEDPVTGSSFTVLTPYWSKVYAQTNAPVLDFQAMQVSKRGGMIRSKINGDRVFISGSAVEFSTGFINL